MKKRIWYIKKSDTFHGLETHSITDTTLVTRKVKKDQLEMSRKNLNEFVVKTPLRKRLQWTLLRKRFLQSSKNKYQVNVEHEKNKVVISRETITILCVRFPNKLNWYHHSSLKP